MKDNGLVSEYDFDSLLMTRVFNQNNLTKLTGYYGLGHVRYPTAGSPDRNEAQPFYTNYPYHQNWIHIVVTVFRLRIMGT